MKRVYIIIFLVLFFVRLPFVQAVDLEIHSKNAILYNLDEDKVLYEKNSSEEISIASLTKIMTALIVIENTENLNEKVVLVAEDFEGLALSNASVAHFYLGEEVTIRDLLYGLLFPSGADAAQALTRIFGGKEAFVEKMNEKAKSLNLSHTHFQNETGLDEDGHYSTVADVVVFFREALANEVFRTILETKEYQTSNGSKIFQSPIQRYLSQTQLKMDYLIGGKTGTTYEAGLCLASFANYNGTNYLLVTARASNDWRNPKHFFDAKTIYEYFIKHYEKKIILAKGTPILELKTKFAVSPSILFSLEEDIFKYVPVDFSQDDISFSYSGEDEINPLTKVGEVLGTLTIFYFDEPVKEIEIVLSNKVSFDCWKFLKFYSKEFFTLFILFLICFIIIVVLQKKRKKKRKKVR